MCYHKMFIKIHKWIKLFIYMYNERFRKHNDYVKTKHFKGAFTFLRKITTYLYN